MNLHIKRNSIFLTVGLILVLVSACKQEQSQLVFDSPEAAIQTLSELIGPKDDQRTEQVLVRFNLGYVIAGNLLCGNVAFGNVRRHIRFDGYGQHGDDCR